MSKIELLNELEAQEASLKRKIEALRNQVKTLADFSKRVAEEAVAEGLKLRDVALAICPELNPEGRARRGATAGLPGATRQPRKLKVYLNPLTGEEIQTKGGNHKLLKQWKAEYGAEEVEAWLVKDTNQNN